MDGSVAKRKRTEMQQCSMFSDRSSCSVSFTFFNVLNHFSHLRSLNVKKTSGTSTTCEKRKFSGFYASVR